MKNALLNPYCLDKIAFTFEVDEQYRKRAKSRLNQMVLGNERFCTKTGIETHCAPVNKKSFKRHYHNNYKLKINSGFSQFTTIVSIQPKARSVNYMRVEFNPNRARKSGLIAIQKLIRFICGKKAVTSIYSQCRITRADVCIDSFTNMQSLYPYYPGIRVSKIYRNVHGKLETHRIGKGGSKKLFSCYDKIAELLKSGKTINLEGPFYRLELKITKQGYSMSRLNPYAFYEAMSNLDFFSENLLLDKYFDKKFLARVWKAGVNKALATQSKNKRIRYLRRLRTYHMIECPFPLDEILEVDFRRILQVFDPTKNCNPRI